MKHGTLAILLAGILAFAGTLMWRGFSPPAPPQGITAAMGAEDRILAYNQQIEELSRIDPALVLYRETHTWTPEGLDAVTAVAVDAADRIYAGGGTAVLIRDKQKNMIRKITTEANVSSLAVDEEHNLYVGARQVVYRFDADGTPAGVFADLGPEALITSLASVGETVFVADARSRTVQRFNRDGSLEFVIDGKTGLQDATGFVVPSPYFDMAPSQGGTLWIVNPGRHRLEEYNLSGERITAWPEQSGLNVETFCGCCNPTHIARLSDGSIVTSEKGVARIKVYTSRGRFTGVVATPAQFDGHDVSLDLAVDSNDRILVGDPARRQIRIFERGE